MSNESTSHIFIDGPGFWHPKYTELQERKQAI